MKNLLECVEFCIFELENYYTRKNNYFTFNNTDYNINLANKLCLQKQPIKIPLSLLKQDLLDYPITYNKRYKISDISIPIIIWEHNGIYIIVDGRHRVQKSIDLKNKDIFGYIFSDIDMNKIKETNDKY